MKICFSAVVGWPNKAAPAMMRFVVTVKVY